MATPVPPRRWHRFRVIFRRCRITVLLVILALIGFVLYLDKVGLPNFIKDPLVEKLHARGLDLQFTRLRLRLNRGIVAENVFVGRTNDVSSPQLTLKEVHVQLDYAALLKRHFQIQSLQLRQGQLTWPVVSATNGPARQLSIENIQTDLQLLTNDVWELDNLQAQFGGANIELSGSLTNASVVRDWKMFHGKPAAPGTLQARLRRVADTLEQIHFTAPPQLKLDVRGDARQMENIAVRLYIKAPGAETPWGSADGFNCYVLLAPPRSNQLSRAQIDFHAAHAATRWATTTNLALTLRLFTIDQETNIVHANLDLTADTAQSRSNRADQIRFSAQWFHSLTNPIPLSGAGQLQGHNIVTEWGSAKQFAFSATLLPSTNAVATNGDWAWWSRLAPYPLKIEGSADQVHSRQLDLEKIICSGQWFAPELTVDKLSAKLYGGSMDADARLDIATRAVTFKVASDFDGKKIAPLLTPTAQEWLANYSWNHSPQIKAEGALILPASVWTNRHPDWRGELRPTLRLNGQFHVADGAFRGVHALTADAHFYYSNMCWRLPDLVAVRPEGKLNLEHESNERTKDFYFHLHSTIDPHALRPLLATNQWRVFDYFSLSQPPVVDGEIRGRWHNHETINGKAHVIVTNFTVRGESADKFEADVEYTNRVLWVLQPRVQLAVTQHLSADSVKIVFDKRKMYVTNGFSTADPAVVVHAIGPHVEHAVNEYHFLKPPSIHVEGVVPLHDPHDADLHFDVDGNDFEWWKFEVPKISGKIDWVGEHLAVRNVTSDFYFGKASGNAAFDFLTNHTANFKFDLVATDASLHLLARDLTDGKTNKLEGLLNLRLEVTDANSGDWRHLDGAGRVDLRDGLIWDIPIFGVFSPALDTIMPGLGSSRARQGSATFTITNGVIDSEDLKVETLMARLRYWGTLDLLGAVNARMEAELFRNTWVVGPVLSLALWPVSKTFEYKITGTIHKPKSDPVFIPKVLFFPLHPVQTIKGMIPPPEQTNTNLFPDVPP